MIRRLLFVLLVCLMLAATAHVSLAGSVTGNLPVTATVAASCSLISTTAVDFGTVGSTESTANGDITVNCNSTLEYDIALNAGSAPGVYRSMASSSGNFTQYFLYKDSAQTSQWGDSNFANTYPGGTALHDVGSGFNQPHTVYGITYGAVGDQPGTYTDTVLVTVWF